MAKSGKFRPAILGLSALLLSTSLVGCGGEDDYTLTVSVFGNAQDGELNRSICERWAEEYTQTLRSAGKIPKEERIKINFSVEENDEQYFTTLTNAVMSGDAPDVFYLSPKYVKTWAKGGQVLDLTPYFSENDKQTLGDLWENGLSFYGYSADSGYTQGDRISWNGTRFVTEAGKTAGLYGLPKDYSSFGLGYNGVFFTPALKEKYTTTLATATRSVRGASDNTKNLTFTGEAGRGVVTYAVPVTAEQSYDGRAHAVGEDAPILNIGIPTTYKPYNFYRFTSFESAVAGGDIVANTVQKLTNGKGYTVTIPGFPAEQFDLPDGVDYDEDAPYDSEKGYITYTFAEYSALTWALTFYLNTFAWEENANGVGGRRTATGAWQNVYGNDQYDGTLYLLPWLAGNDASYLNSASTKAVNGNDSKTVGTASEGVQKLTLSGEMEERQVQYGVNSANYIETYGAFLSYGSDWNGNSNTVGDTSATKASGWEYFCQGAQLFYGAGTWDASTRNETDWKYLQFHQMPEPVGEKYALYSQIKDADYGATLKEYSYQNSNPVTGKRVYTRAEILANQAVRQDKWGARMDSVGYGVNGELEDADGDEAWKKEGAVSLVRALTVQPEVQKTLTYAGAQLPNFKSQCEDFLTGDENGDFSDMVTPENENWSTVYEIARSMVRAGGGTVSQWMKENHPTVKYDEGNYGKEQLSTVDDLAYAMKILYLVPYTRADRDLCLRMQSGLNSVRDAGVYTYNTKWLQTLEGRGSTYLLAYESKSKNFDANKLERSNLFTSAKGFSALPNNQFATPKWFCLYKASLAQKELDDAIKQEQNLLA